MTEIVKKLTLKTIGCGKTEISAAVKGKTEAIVLASILGISNEARPGQTDMGSFLKFIGSFQATNHLTGEVFSSAVALLPDVIADQLGAAIHQSGEVEFAVQILARADEKSAVGYVYSAKPLIEAKPSDKFAALMAKAQAAAPALPLFTPAAAADDSGEAAIAAAAESLTKTNSKKK